MYSFVFTYRVKKHWLLYIRFCKFIPIGCVTYYWIYLLYYCNYIIIVAICCLFAVCDYLIIGVQITCVFLVFLSGVFIINYMFQILVCFFNYFRKDAIFIVFISLFKKCDSIYSYGILWCLYFYRCSSIYLWLIDWILFKKYAQIWYLSKINCICFWKVISNTV